MPVQLVDERGRPIRLGEKLGEGGEGCVYRVAGEAGRAVKIYTEGLVSDRAIKIQILATLGSPDIHRFAAWPSGLVLDKNGAARGLLLPVVEQGRDIHNLYNPSSRRKSFPKADWRFLVHVSANVARAFAAVHDLGLVIGDVNPGSILVLEDGTVRLIDVDSFQVPVQGRAPLLCTVGVELFTPPELQQARLNSVIRSTNHDAFGLAITIFHLLMLGRHPYAGRYLGSGDMPIERAIAEHRFAFGARASDSQMQRPPNAVGLEILPAEMSALFESAFARAGGHRRPSAVDWVRALDRLGADLLKCGRTPTHYHHKSSSLCPWCLLEQATGAILFGAPLVTPARGLEVEYQNLIRLISAVPAPMRPTSVAVSPARVASPEAVEASTTGNAVWVSYLMAAVLFVCGVLLLQHGGVLLVFLGFAVVGAIRKTSRRGRERWVEGYRAAAAEHAQATSEYERSIQFPRYAFVRGAASRADESWRNLPRLKANLHQQMEGNRRKIQLEHFLQGQLIGSAKIPGIGRGGIAMLSAYGIDNAKDVDAARIQQVPQFGPKKAERLVAWRKEREHKFVYDPSRPIPREALLRVDQRMEDEQRKILEGLRKTLRDLQAARTSETAVAADAARRLQSATLALSQAEADVRAATGGVPG